MTKKGNRLRDLPPEVQSLPVCTDSVCNRLTSSDNDDNSGDDDNDGDYGVDFSDDDGDSVLECLCWLVKGRQWRRTLFFSC